jgi:hypothetical protein
MGLCDRGMQRLMVKQDKGRCGECRASQQRKNDLTEAT